MAQETSSYLQRHLENPESLGDSRAAHERLSKPLGEVVWAEKGDVHLTSGDWEISFSYRPPTEEEISSLNPDYVKIMGIDAKRYRMLENLTFVNKDGNAEISLKAMLPQGYKVVFAPESKSPSGGSADVECKTIYVRGDITCPRKIMDLLHEIGHGVYFEQLPTASDQENWLAAYRQYQRGKGGVSIDGLENVLRAERNAWAFVLKNLKPLFRGSTIHSDLLYILKKLKKYLECF